MSFFGEEERVDGDGSAGGSDRGFGGFEVDSLFGEDAEGADYSSMRSSVPPFLFDDADGGASGVDAAPELKFGNLDYIAPGTVAPALGVYGGGNDLNYLFAEDFLDYRKKTWGQQMMYWAGTSWVVGGAFGGLQGVVEGLKSSMGKSLKLRVNSLLNAVGKRGLLVANTAGVLALMLSMFESTSYNFITQDESPVNYAISGVAAGLLFKSTKMRTPPGLKQAAMWSAGLSALGLGVIYPTRQGYYGKELQGML
eukprot:Plantae.Rhodophyta-Purpureofilum_apyrenoidigerum.ctg39994.p1 GENE.Plantae.Rhodophyta-Purpureofilum_apyrenoidigerum.ctg39994~~Plantae.Rhodophyta-Purpureofilum_apyrenoidigerum.ctg39994.p1  ORF type:complete len:270 (+),score=53.44 Plantae.Rhodophyta-Purpureofilum_apyrenoidigerum.ctg39994:52-810(+)